MKHKMILSLLLLFTINSVLSDEYVNSTIPITGSEFCSEIQFEYDIFLLSIDAYVPPVREARLFKEIQTVCRIVFRKKVEKHLAKTLLIEKGLLKNK